MELLIVTLKQFLSRFSAAIEGLRVGFKDDRSIRMQWIIAIMVIIVFLILNISLDHWLWIIVCCGLVISLEYFNSAIEELSNMISTERNHHIKLVKDFSAAAVFVASITSALIAIIIFLHYI